MTALVRVSILVGAVAMLGCAAAHAGTASSAGPTLTASDSALAGRILLAEDRRDSADAALLEGSTHPNSRVRLLARRALARIRDPRFAARDSFGTAALSVAWAEPAWRLRYRALTKTSDCNALRTATGDASWPVRLRAADLVTLACSADDALADTLQGWIDALPADASRRPRDGVSWQAAAHGLVAVARLRQAGAEPRIARLATHAQWQVRAYAARASGALATPRTDILRTLARDENDNVKEAAIETLSRVSGHADDELYLAALEARGAQAVRAGAVALKGSPRPDVAPRANAVFVRWVARANASERDARIALLEAAGRPERDDRPPAARYELPPRAVALAFGADVRLRVLMSRASGGGSFVVRLRGDVAPMMAARVLALARSGYYDGGDWHRVEHDFVIQGPSPGSNEYVGAAQYLRDELGTVPHLRGAVGMSTRGHDTGDAQWFVDLRDNLRLNRDYTVFGEIVEGMDVVDGILEGDVIARIEEVR